VIPALPNLHDIIGNNEFSFVNPSNWCWCYAISWFCCSI